MTRHSFELNWQPDFKPGDEARFPTLKRWDQIPAVAYVSGPGAEYYQLGKGDLPRPAPYAEAVTLSVELLGLRSEQNEEGDPVVERLKALRYTSNRGVTGVFGLRGGAEGSPLLGGRVLFFGFVYNPDPGTEGVAVHRTVALGLKARRRLPGDSDSWGDLAFLREVDTFGSGFPAIVGTDDDFQIFSSPAAFPDPRAPKGPFLAKDLILTAGAISDLASDSSTRAA